MLFIKRRNATYTGDVTSGHHAGLRQAFAGCNLNRTSQSSSGEVEWREKLEGIRVDASGKSISTHPFEVGRTVVDGDFGVGELPRDLGRFVAFRSVRVEQDDAVFASHHATLATHTQRRQNVVA